MAKVQIPETLLIDNKTFFAGAVEVDDKTAQRIKAELARREEERDAFDAAAEESNEQLGTGTPQMTEVSTKPTGAERAAAHRAKQKAERDAAVAKEAADKAAAEAAAAQKAGTGEGSGEQK